MNEIEKQIKESCTFQNEIEEILTAIIILDDNQRDILLVGFLTNALCHYRSIVVLIERRLYHSAFALFRVLFENVVRGLYMYNTFDDDKIKKLYHSENWDAKEFFKGKMQIICKDIDNTYGNQYGKLSFEKTRKKVYSCMCDYTHTGPQQIARNFNNAQSTIESTFSEDLIVSTLSDSSILINVFAAMCFDHLKIEEKKIDQ